MLRKFPATRKREGGVTGQAAGTGMNTASVTTFTNTANEKQLIQSLKALHGRQCADDYEKYKLLDERDKLMYKIRAVGGSCLSVLQPCPDMCAEKERYVRIVQNRVSIFEKDSDGRCILTKMVKEYSRSAADQEMPLPHELRSPKLMEFTMDYLLQKVMEEMPDTPEKKTQWYDFLWSRTRAIRKELTQQALVDTTAVRLVEKCTRLHIVVAYVLCNLMTEQFDQKMNTENLGKSLQTLRHLYEDLNRKGIHCPNEAEFRAYDMMLYLNDPNVLRQACQYRAEIRSSEPVRLAIQLATCVQTNNYIKFFRLLTRDATYLQCCVCHRYFEHLRYSAFCIITKGYRQSAFSIQRLQDMLAWDREDQTIDALNVYGFVVNDEGIVELSRKFFTKPQTDILMQHYDWIDDKMDGGLSAIVYGPEGYREVEPPTKLVESFDVHDHYVNDPILHAVLKAAGNSVTKTSSISSGAMAAAATWSERAEKPANPFLGTYGSTQPISLPPNGQNLPQSQPSSSSNQLFPSHAKETTAQFTAPAGQPPKFESVTSKWGAKSLLSNALSGIQKPNPPQQPAPPKPLMTIDTKYPPPLFPQKMGPLESRKTSIFGSGGFGSTKKESAAEKSATFTIGPAKGKTDEKSSIFDKKFEQKPAIFGEGLPTTSLFQPVKDLPSSSIFFTKQEPEFDPISEQAKVATQQLTDTIIYTECDSSLQRLISEGMETEMKASLIRKKLDSAREITHKLVECTTDDVVEGILEQIAKEEFRKEQLSFVDSTSRNLLESTWATQCLPLIDATAKCITRLTVAEQQKRIRTGLSQFNSAMQRLWLMQFVTHWRAFAVAKKERRENRQRAIRDFAPNYSNTSFALENYSKESPKAKQDKVSRNSFGFGDLSLQIKVSMLRRKRIERLARWAAERWLRWTRMRVQGRRFYSKVGHHSLDVYLEESQLEENAEQAEDFFQHAAIFPEDDRENISQLQFTPIFSVSSPALSRKRRLLGISAIHPEDSFYDKFDISTSLLDSGSKRLRPSSTNFHPNVYSFKPPKMRSAAPASFDYSIMDASNHRILPSAAFEESMVTEEDVELAADELEKDWSLNETAIRSARAAREWYERSNKLQQDKHVHVDEGLVNDAHSLVEKNSALEVRASTLRTEMEDFSAELERSIARRHARETGLEHTPIH